MALRALEKNARRILEDAEQSHLLDHLNCLEGSVRENYLRSLLEVDYEDVNRLFARANATSNGDVLKLDEFMRPLGDDQLEAEERCDEAKLELYYRQGLLEVAKGHVGVILMAGGQGSRLGVSYPKGMYNVGLLSEKSLFQLQAERILKVQVLAEEMHHKKGNIVWYIMTSGPTYDDTADFLKKHNYFGLDAKNVVLFKQGLLPCFDNEGKILQSSLEHLALAPDGNGGIYKALDVNGILDDFDRRNIKYLHCHSVDNILVKVADPMFIGYCVKKGADCGAKVVQKTSPTECVGVLCLVDNRVQVVEYSEITEATANLRNEDGSLVFNAGNICNHFFSAEFLREIASIDMPLHVARKKIAHVDVSGKVVTPNKPNGVKIEKFVFDVFAFSKNFVAWEVPRSTEFSALKNADSAEKDCPRTARADLYRLHRYYLTKAGATVEGEEVEISPELTYAGEGLQQFRGCKLQAPILIKQ